MIEEPPALTIKRPSQRPTAKQIEAFQGVATGFVVDAMYGAGALDITIQPIGDGRDIHCYAAGPVLTADNGPADILATSAALAFLQPGDILVAGFGAYQGCAAAGDRVAGMVKNNGAIGFVTDGPMRDYSGIIDVGLPCWCTGLTPGSPYSNGPGTVGLPIQIGGQQVATGDIMVADRDGVVVVPFEQIDRVIAELDRVVGLEKLLDAKVAEGLTVAPSVTDLLQSDRVQYLDD
ncbi:MAG: RraA family protein [Pikeienuella sp.]